MKAGRLLVSVAAVSFAATEARAAGYMVSPSTSLSSGAITTPSSTLTSSTATSLTSGQLIASSATAGSIVVPAFTLQNGGGGALGPKLNLTTNATSGWGNVTVQINEWTAAPTYTNGDGGTYAATTAGAILLDQYSCTFTQFVDGAQAICVPNLGTVSVFQAVTGANIYWDLQATSTATKTSGQKFTLTPGLLN